MEPRADDLRTAGLLFDAELAAGALAPSDLRPAARSAALRVRPVPAAPRRLADDVRRKLGRLDYEAAVAAPLARVRREVLGARADAPPRFLVRVDEFPHYRAADAPARYGTAGFERFHDILAGAGVPYLLAVVPRVSTDPLSPSAQAWRPLTDEEDAVLHRVAGEGVTLALHGLDHRTRFTSPRRHSELSGLSPADLDRRLDTAVGELAARGHRADVFVAPYNRFDAAQLPALTRRFRVVCGGPESVRTLGFHLTPQWRGDGVYLPSYAPLYGGAAAMIEPVRRLIAARAGLWVPLVLHWGWEADAGWAALERLAAELAPHAVPWDDLLGAMERCEAGLATPVQAGG